MVTIVRRAIKKVHYKREQARLLAAEVARRERARGAGRTAGTIACVPERPYPHSVLRPIAAELGLEISGDSGPARCIFFWSYSTVRVPPEALARLAKHRCVYNIASLDIAKSTVSAAFEQAFGYQLRVDPSIHLGEALEKPEKNAAHTGRSVCCPMAPRPGYSYQLIIDNVDGATVEDIRVPVYAGLPVLSYLKYRPLGDRFSNTNSRVELVGTSSVLSLDEQQNIGAMARLLGADYCEMDCLRDRGTGRLYVVDVNTTPWGPPNGLPAHDAERAIRQLASEFERRFL